MQPMSHFIHKLSSLREEFLCSTYGRVMQSKINFEFHRQMLIFKENEIRNGSVFDKNNSNLDFGIKTYIPSSFKGGPTHWKNLSNEAFLLSVSLGPPTFFITITENPYWPEIIALDNISYLNNSSLLMRVFKQRRSSFLSYLKISKIFGDVKGFVWRDEYQQRGLPHSHILLWTNFDTENIDQIDSVISCKIPNDPIYDNRQKNKDLSIIIKKYETHCHTKRCCPDSNSNCCFNYPKDVKEKTKIINGRFEFERGETDSMIQ